MNAAPLHDFDDDGCCVHCNFDGAEFHWWKHSTYEGRAQPDARQPHCTEHDAGRRAANVQRYRSAQLFEAEWED